MEQTKKTITNFFNNDYADYGSYDNYRKVANYIDGLKPSARKILYTIITKNIREQKKVSQLVAITSELTAYLHGEVSLIGVVVGLAQNFVGSNNIPLLTREGNFGSRLIPAASAARYIFTCKEKYLDSLFHTDDSNILISQEFEGDIIEPQFYVPIIPLLLVNGSVGISTGFAQKILPRNYEELIDYILHKLDNKKQYKIEEKLLPFYKGFKGSIKKIDDSSFEIWGKLDRVDQTTIKITELPVGYDRNYYASILDKLEDEKIINSYTDLSTGEIFEFQIKASREFIKQSDYELYDNLKLIDRITENYTCNDENMKIRQFGSVIEILDEYIKIRLEYYDKRKSYLLNQLKNNLTLLYSKYIFIKNVVEEKIVIHNKPTEQIEKKLETFNEIKKIDNNYDYLLRLPINSLTKEKYIKLKEEIQEIGNKIKELSNKSKEDLWREDLKKLPQF